MEIIKKHYSKEEIRAHDSLISLRHRGEIQVLSKDLKSIDSLSQFCLYIKTPFQQPLHVTTADHWSITYNKHGFDQVDLTCEPLNGFASPEDECYFVREKSLSSGQAHMYKNMEAYHINETVALVRRCKEAYIVGVFHHAVPVKNPALFYQNKKSDLEEFMDHFMGGMSAIAEKEHGVLAQSKLMKNASYRKQVIRNPGTIKRLSAQEQRIIHLFTMGLALKEISSIMQLKEKTIRNYIENVKKKLGTSTMLQTVLAAHNLGLMIEGNSQQLNDL